MPTFDLEATLSDGQYLMRRLAVTRRAQELSASEQFDLARTPLTDDELERAVEAFGGERPAAWGFAELVQDALSKEEPAVAVEDLAELQRRLIAQGYAPPEVEPTGEWDDSWYGALRRADSDARSEFLQGHHPGAAPLEAGIRMITNTIPSAVWQGTVGAARGIIEQAPETAERAGALGGAAAGAAIGATAASVIGPLGTGAGAIGGAIIGGAAGFLADLLGSDEGEEDQSAWERVADALTPFEEYSGNPKAFFEDLGFVASAASLVAGAGIAKAGVQAGLGLARTTASEGGLGFGAALLRKPGPAVPGWFTRITAAAARPALGVERVEQLVGWVKLNGLRAQAGRPIFQTIQGGYTGMSAGQLGARMVAGIQTGTAELDADIAELQGRLNEPDLSENEQRAIRDELFRLEQQKDAARTKIQEAIEETSPLPSYLDLLGFVVNPTQFLPVKLGQIGNAARRVMGSTELLPYAHIIQREARFAGESLSLREAVARAKSLGRDEFETALLMTFHRRNFGVDMVAAEMVADLGKRGAALEGAFNRARASVIAEIRGAGASGEPNGALAERVLRWSVEDPVRFEAWMLNRRGPSSLPQYLEAERLATRTTQDIREGVLPLEASQIRGEVVADAVAEWHRFSMQAQMQELIAKAEKLEQAAKRTTDVPAGLQMRQQATALRAEAAKIKRELPVLHRIERTEENVVIVPERLDTLTSQQFHALAEEFDKLRQQVASNAKAGPGTAAWIDAKMRLGRFLDELSHRIEIPEEVLAGASRETPSGSLAGYLKRRAKTAAGEIDLGPDLMARFESLGYKPVVTSGDVLLTDDVLAMGELQGAGDYTRRAAFFETLGFGARKVPDESLAKLRDAHEVAELGQVMEEAGLAITGRQAQSRLRDRLAALRRRGVQRGPLNFDPESRAPVQLPRVDVRDLSPEDILSAFDDVAGFTDDTARAVFGALKRGAAYGAEVKLAAPTDTVRSLGRALRLNGLPGFSDFMRTARIHDPNRLVPLSAFAGAGIGLAFGDEELEDALKGALGGALVGLGARAFAKGAYGYLPDRLVKLNSALRYSLNLTFDAGRYSEAATTMMAKYELPGMVRPRKYVGARQWRSPYAASVSGEEAWRHAERFLDELNGGTSYLKWAEDIDRRASAVGLLGFNPREHEVGYAWLAYQRGWGRQKIREVVSQVNRYGSGRTAAEKSANFIFFPFSFSKKYLTTLGDWFLQAPARALLLHEGLRRYHESTLDERFSDLVENHAPLLRELSRINNLVYGISPGRFFLKGLSDNRSGLGKVSQILASIFVPSGAATPLAQAAGGLGDFTIHAFTPVVLTGESMDRAGGIDGLEDVFARYLPLLRDIEDYREATADQITALKEGRTQFAQYRSYVDELREAKADLEPLALALGYASVDGFLQSDLGAAFGGDLEELRVELQEKYPTGWRMAQQFENSEAINERALLDLADKPNRSEAEDAILWLREELEKWRVLGEVAGVSDLTDSLAAQQVRSLALHFAGDRRFGELWERFFARELGPIRKVA